MVTIFLYILNRLTDILVYALIVAVFLFEFLHTEFKIVPKALAWTPELIALGIAANSAILFAIKKKILIRLKYFWLFFSFFLLVVTGVFINLTPSAPIIIGIRTYFKQVPFFILPMVHEVGEKNFRFQLMLILFFLFLQVPVSLYQRLIKYEGVLTGDVITGTVQLSSTLTLLMMSAIAILFGLYIKEKLKLSVFLLLCLVLFIPTTINETKVTLFLIPLIITITLFFDKSYTATKKLNVAVLGFFLIIIFIPVYNFFILPRTGQGISGFITDKREMQKYFYEGTDQEDLSEVRRGDALAYAYEDLIKRPVNFIIGLGAGNVVDSVFINMKGKYIDKQKYRAGRITASIVFWELGLLGLMIYLTYYYFIYKDVKEHSKIDDYFGAISLGWISVVAIMTIGFVYTNTIQLDTINYLFAYISGVLIAETCKNFSSEEEVPIHND